MKKKAKTESLEEKFGLTNEQIEARASSYEQGDWSGMEFGRPTRGRPSFYGEKMEVLSFKAPAAQVEAMGRAARELGISRSEWCRRAVEEKLAAQG